MKSIVLVFCLFASVAVHSEVKLYTLEAAQPANLSGDHYVQKCDSQRTRRRAHQLGFMSNQKRLDVEMQSECLKVCNNLDGESAVSCVRECNDKEREQRKDGWSSGSNLINAGSSILLLLKAL
jgi:hypothetical protein